MNLAQFGRAKSARLVVVQVTVILSLLAVAVFSVPIIDPNLGVSYWVNAGDMITVERGNETVRLTMQDCNNAGSGNFEFFNATVVDVITNTTDGLSCNPFGSVCSLETPGVGCDTDTVSFGSDEVDYDIETCDIVPACDCFDRFQIELDYDDNACPTMLLTGSGPPYDGTFNLNNGSVAYGTLIELDSDSDSDAICDNADNCDNDFNPSQEDVDKDGLGDACDNCTDVDWDGFCDETNDCDDHDNTTYPGAPELCDFVDNDCDGKIDEDINQTQNCGLGVCSGGVQYRTCTNGIWDSWSTCSTSGLASSETCDSLDNDCDGQIDEDFPNLGNACSSSGIGACITQGVLVCAANGTTTECNATPGTPTNETCDSLDNDCDGQADEDFPNLGNACSSSGIGACITQGVLVCAANGTTTECNATPGTPTNETCDGIDNDCDGDIDENLTSIQSCGAGACSGGNQSGICINSTWSWAACSTSNMSSSESCDDGIDNDCDGKTDCSDSDCDSSSKCKSTTKKKDSGGGSDSSGGVMQILSSGQMELPQGPAEKEPVCNCTNDSAKITVFEAGDILNITVTKLNDCENEYVLLITDPTLVSEKVFDLTYYGDKATFFFTPDEDWINLKARLYCKDVYTAGRIDDYIDIKVAMRNLDESSLENQGITETPTGQVIGADTFPWLIGLLLLIAIFLLARRRKKQQEEQM